VIRFSVIIPTLNEEEAIGRCLDAVRDIDPAVEIIVADGGSTDRTVELAENHGVVVCRCSRGRGRQMNAGASLAKGDVLLFLHADTFLPAGAFNRLSSILTEDHVELGVFGLTFDMKHWLLGLGLLERLSVIGPKWLRFGDSSITIRRDFFRSLGGFPDQPLFEDLELLRRAARRTRIERIPMKVTTSARRFIDNGVVRQLARNVYYTARYFFGTPPEDLAAEYERGNRRLDRKSLLMMVRYPEPGKVKSRLAAEVGSEQAAGIYRTCAEILFSAATALPEAIRKYVYCAAAGDSKRIASWTDGRFHCIGQPEGDLATRLERGFATAFKQGATKAVLVASDVPGISSPVLEQAFNALARHDVVIGPSTDGGYYLIGLKRRQPQLFRNITWSTAVVLDQTLKAAEKSGLSVFLLPPLQDIDTADDWRRWRQSQITNSSAIEVRYASV
jgi:rSAM/selenodomain-associated transferase 2/rSAM/selenodomain-associated transferase 1